MKVKPYQFVIVQREAYSHIGEVMSFETPDQTAMVRRAPGHPGTLEEVPIALLRPVAVKPRYVHYAEVSGWGSFPLDMLRYDVAAPVNFMVKETEGLLKAVTYPDFEEDRLIIAHASHEAHPSWTVERWMSFIWVVRELTTEKLGEK
jgi:hypothetical protein